MGTARRAHLSRALLAALLSATCTGESPAGPDVWSILAEGSPPASPVVGSALPAVSVKLVVNGAARAGATINLSADAGTVTPTQGTTDADGRLSIQWTLGTAAGAQRLTAAAQGSDAKVVVTVTAVADRPAVITTSTDSVAFDALQDSLRITATVADRFGNPTTAAVSFAMDAAPTATIGSTGWVRAVGNGVASVMVSSDTATKTIPIVVAQRLTALTLSAAPSCFGAIGDTARVTLAPRDRNGNAIASAVASWTSRDSAIASVNDSGLVRARANGQSWLVATAVALDTKRDSVQACVAQQVHDVAIAPATDTINAIGHTRPFAASAADARGANVAGTTFTYTSLDPSIATVSSSGIAVGAAPGTARIVASTGTRADTARLVVRQVAAAVDVSIDRDTLIAGTQRSAVGTVHDSANVTIAGATLTWSSSVPTVATVSAAGVVSAHNPGATYIRAVSGALRDSVLVRVIPVPVSTVQLDATAASLWPGAADTISAVAKDSAGGTLAGRVVAFAAADTGIASVSASGVVTARAPGTTAITVTIEGKQATFTVTVRTPGSFETDAPSYAPYRIATIRLPQSVATVDTLTGALGDTAVLLHRSGDSTFAFLVPLRAASSTRLLTFMVDTMMYTDTVVVGAAPAPVNATAYVTSWRQSVTNVLDSLDAYVAADTTGLDKQRTLDALAEARDSLAAFDGVMSGLTAAERDMVVGVLRAHSELTQVGASSAGAMFAAAVAPIPGCTTGSGLQMYKCGWAKLGAKLPSLGLHLAAAAVGTRLISMGPAGLGISAVLSVTFLVRAADAATLALPLAQWTALASWEIGVIAVTAVSEHLRAQPVADASGSSLRRVSDRDARTSPSGRTPGAAAAPAPSLTSFADEKPVTFTFEARHRNARSTDASHASTWLASAVSALNDFNAIAQSKVPQLAIPFAPAAAAWVPAEDGQLSVVSNDPLVQVSTFQRVSGKYELAFTTDQPLPREFTYDLVYTTGEFPEARVRLDAEIRDPWRLEFSDGSPVGDTVDYVHGVTRGFVLFNDDLEPALVNNSTVAISESNNPALDLAFTASAGSFSITATSESVGEVGVTVQVSHGGKVVKKFWLRVRPLRIGLVGGGLIPEEVIFASGVMRPFRLLFEDGTVPYGVDHTGADFSTPSNEDVDYLFHRVPARLEITLTTASVTSEITTFDVTYQGRPAGTMKARVGQANYAKVILTSFTGDRRGFGRAVNDSGDVLVHSDAEFPERLYRYRGGVLQDIGNLGGTVNTDTRGGAMNKHGVVVGWSGRINPFSQRAVRWDGGPIQDLGNFAGNDTLRSEATGINASGVIVGWSEGYFQPGCCRSIFRRAFRWQNGVMTDLGSLSTWESTESFATAINDSGVIIGVYRDPLDQPFIIKDGVMSKIDLSSLASTTAALFGLSNAGHVVGWAQKANGDRHGFLWKDGVVVHDFGNNWQPRAVNSRGQVVGVSPTGRAFLWENGSTRILDAENFSAAYAISENGKIAGYSIKQAVLWVPVSPE